MGRPRGFDESAVVRSASRLFVRRGYEATSVDDLVAGCGLHRGSLYRAFGSKRGVFLAALGQLVDEELPSALADGDDLIHGDTLDLLLIAAVELASRDEEVRALLDRACSMLPTTEHDRSTGAAAVLGARLLQRARTRADHSKGSNP